MPRSPITVSRLCIGLGLVVGVGSAACTAVAPYERMQLNDADMKLAARNSETFEHNVESYREGATGANGGKIGGGCGCN